MGNNDRYIIISADCHAGLPCEEYRPYLDPKYSEAFEGYLAERKAIRDQRMADSGDYVTHWEEENAEGLTGAYDPVQRDRELDGDGVAGEVLFPDADAITGNASPPFGAGLSAADITDPELAFAGARAPTTGSSRICARTVPNGAPASRWCRSPTTSRARLRRSSGRPRTVCAEASSSPRCGASTRRTLILRTNRCGPRARRTT